MSTHAVSQLSEECSGACVVCVQILASGTAASIDYEAAVQRLSWRSLAVGKNFSDRRGKLINARARHDDAVSAAMRFLCDTQESTALVFTELDVEMLALNLQFFRLDDVIHFCLRPPSLGSGTLKWKKNPRLFKVISHPSPDSGGKRGSSGLYVLGSQRGGLLCRPLNLDSGAV